MVDLDKIFRLKERDTTIQSEVIGGITTFMTMAYILAIIPSIVSSTGMEVGAIFTATAISALISCTLMGLIANLPLALAPGIGISVFFTYTIVLQMGHSWQTALAAIFIEGIIFVLLSIGNIRSIIIDHIPSVLKKAISAGIGLFITTVGLVNAEVIVKDGSLSTLGAINSPSVYLTFIAAIIIAALLIKKIKGALLIGMVLTTIIGIPLGVVSIPEGFSIFSMPQSLEPIAFKMDFSNIFSIEMAVVIFTLIFSDIFDTAGTLIAVCSESNLTDNKGNPKNSKRAFLADAISTTIGATLGCSTVTTYIESSVGVSAGGRTGLTALVTGLMFLMALFMSPIFSIIPTAATSAVLIIVGLLMIKSVITIDFNDYIDSLPAFITIITIPLSYNIANGIILGFLSYVFIRLLLGKYRDISRVMYILSFIFLANIILLK